MAANDWSNTAKSYAESVAQIPGYFSSIAAQALLQHDAGGQQIRFLDVAAGPGTLASKILDAVEEGTIQVESVIVTDFAAGMVTKAQETLANRANTVHKSFLTMDAQEMSFQDLFFTHLGCMFGIMFFPDRAKGLREMYRVLNHGGIAAIGTWNAADSITIIAEFGAFAQVPNLEQNIAALNAITATCGDPTTFTQELKAVGFRDVSVGVHEQTFSLPNSFGTFQAFADNAVLKTALGGKDASEMYPKWQEFLSGPAGAHWLDEEGGVRLHFVANIAVARK